MEHETKPEGVQAEELEEQTAEELPERAAMSTVGLDPTGSDGFVDLELGSDIPPPDGYPEKLPDEPAA